MSLTGHVKKRIVQPKLWWPWLQIKTTLHKQPVWVSLWHVTIYLIMLRKTTAGHYLTLMAGQWHSCVIAYQLKWQQNYTFRWERKEKIITLLLKYYTYNSNNINKASWWKDAVISPTVHLPNSHPAPTHLWPLKMTDGALSSHWHAVALRWRAGKDGWTEENSMKEVCGKKERASVFTVHVWKILWHKSIWGVKNNTAPSPLRGQTIRVMAEVRRNVPVWFGATLTLFT